MKRIAEPTRWNETLGKLPGAHILQTWEWGSLKERHGWRAEHWVWEVDGEARAAALLLSRPLGPLTPGVMYVPKGPVLDYGDQALLSQVLTDLEALARERRAVFVKIDPDVREDSPEGTAATGLMRRRGWRYSPEQVQFRGTLLLDLTRPLDDILAQMKSKWRYNVRLAVRRGVTVRPGTMADLPVLYEMYLETSLRDRFVIRPESYYRDAWGTFIEAGLAQPLIAEVNGEPVAMVILFRFGQRAWYLYGASRSVHREKMPNHLLQWEAIRWAKEQGCTTYDLWGAPDKQDESDPMWGVYRFKQGFGARFVRHIGAYDYPVRRLAYWTYMHAAPWLLALMRWRHWRRRASSTYRD